MSKIVLMSEDSTLKNKVEALAKSEGVDFECNPVATLPSQSNVLSFPAQTEEKSKTLAQVEAEVISQTLVKCKGNFTEAAKTLGIGRATLYRKVKDYAIQTDNLRKVG